MKSKGLQKNYNYATHHSIFIKVAPLVKLAIISKMDKEASNYQENQLVFVHVLSTRVVISGIYYVTPINFL